MLDADRILRVLTQHEVNFLVIGALAATMQGSPLRTEDIDICPSRSEENLTRLASALVALNAGEWDPRKDEVAARDWSAELLATDKTWILITDHGRLDLVFAPAGATGYEELKPRSLEVRLDDLIVRVAALDDVIRSKEATGRDRDLAQLPTLKRLRELRDRDAGPAEGSS